MEICKNDVIFLPLTKKIHIFVPENFFFKKKDKNMDIEVLMYVEFLKTFFDENPGKINTLIKKGLENDFYEEIMDVSQNNVLLGHPPTLTNEQMISLCVKINRLGGRKLRVPVQKGFFHNIILN